MAISRTVVQPQGSGGVTSHVMTGFDASNAEEVLSASAVTIRAVTIKNGDSATRFVKLYDAGSITLGTTVPEMVLPVYLAKTRTYHIPEGIAFGTGLVVAMVTTGGTAGTTGPTVASEVTVIVD